MEKIAMNEMLSLANIHVPERSISSFEGGSKSFDLGWFDDQDGAGKKGKGKGKGKGKKISSKKKKGSKSCGLVPFSGGAKKGSRKKGSKKGSKRKKGSKKGSRKKVSKKFNTSQHGGVIRYDDEFNEF